MIVLRLFTICPSQTQYFYVHMFFYKLYYTLSYTMKDSEIHKSRRTWNFCNSFCRKRNANVINLESCTTHAYVWSLPIYGDFIRFQVLQSRVEYSLLYCSLETSHVNIVAREFYFRDPMRIRSFWDCTAPDIFLQI